MVDAHRVHAGGCDGGSRSGRAGGPRVGWSALGLVGILAGAACGTGSVGRSTNPSPPAAETVASGEARSTAGSAAAESGTDARRAIQPVGWRVRPSFKYDVLCLVNALTGDPYYLHYYQAEYDRLAPRLTPKVRSALANLQREIKTEGAASSRPR